MRLFSALLFAFLAVLAGCKTTPPPSYRPIPGAQASYPPPKEPVRVVENASFDSAAMLRDGHAVTGIVTVYTLDRDVAERDARFVSMTSGHGTVYVQVTVSMSGEDYYPSSGSGSGMGSFTSTRSYSYGNVTGTATTTTRSLAYGGEPTHYTVYRSTGLAWCNDPALAARQLADRTAKDKAWQLSLELHQAAMAEDRERVRELIAAGAVPNRLGSRHPDLDAARCQSLRAIHYLVDMCYASQLRSAVTQASLRGDAAMLDVLLDGMKGRPWGRTEEAQGDDPFRDVVPRPQLEQGYTTAPFESGLDRSIAVACILSRDRADLLQLLFDHGMTSQDLVACDGFASESGTGSSNDPVARLYRFGAKKILDLLSREETFLGSSIRKAATSRQMRPMPAEAIGGIEGLMSAIELGDQIELERVIVEGADVNGEDANGRTPLTAAAQSQNREALIRLMLHGAKPGQLDGRGLAAIHMAGLASGDSYITEEIQKLLLAFGTDPNLPARSGFTPYQYTFDPVAMAALVGLGATKTATHPTRQSLIDLVVKEADARGWRIPRAWLPRERLLPALREVPSQPDGSDLLVAKRDIMHGGTMYGFNDKQGNLVIDAAFDYALPFTEGLACVRTRGGYGFIGVDGEFVIEPHLLSVEPFSEGLAFATKTVGWGYINRKCHWAIEPRLKLLPLGSSSTFSEGLAAAALNLGDGKIGYIDRTGTFVIAPTFLSGDRFVDGLAKVSVADRDEQVRFGYIDKTGHWVIPPVYLKVNDFSEGLAAVLAGKPISSSSEGRWGFVDREGHMVIPPRFEVVLDFHEGLAVFGKDDLWGFMDKTGKAIVEPKFQNLTSFKDGFGSVMENREGRLRLGKVDREGKLTWLW